MENRKEFQLDRDSLKKAYELNDRATIRSIRSYLIEKYGTDKVEGMIAWMKAKEGGDK